MSPFQSYVISLRDSLDRRQHIDDEFSKHNIDFTFFDAIEISDSDRQANFLSIQFDSNILTPGEVACFLSHVSIWRKLAASDLEEVVIFEDDVWLGQGIHDLFACKSWMPQDYDFIKLETMLMKHDISKKIESRISAGCKRSVQKLLSEHLGTAGYIISKDFAKRCIAQLSIEDSVSYPIDVWVYKSDTTNNQIKLYQLNPAICIQDKTLNTDTPVFDSYLQKERETLNPKRIKKNRKKPKVLFEVLRLYKQVMLLFKPFKKTRIKFY